MVFTKVLTFLKLLAVYKSGRGSMGSRINGAADLSGRETMGPRISWVANPWGRGYMEPGRRGRGGGGAGSGPRDWAGLGPGTRQTRGIIFILLL